MNVNDDSIPIDGGGTRQAGLTRPLQFTLRGLAILVIGVAIGAVEGQIDPGRWSEGLLACLSVWAAFGLGHQISDLRRAYPMSGALTTDERFGWRCAIAWRCAVILLLIAYYCMRTLLAGKQISLPEESLPFAFSPAATLRTALLCFLLMLILWSVPRLRRPAQRRRIPWWGLQVVAAACGAVLCLLLWWRLSFIHFLVHVACVGIEQFQPLRYAIADYNIAKRYPAFVLASAIATGLVAVNLTQIWLLVKTWRHPWWRSSLLVCLLLELTALVGWTAWLMLVGVGRVSPWMAEAFQIGPAHRWLTAAVVVAVAAAALAMLLARTPSCRQHWPILAWRANVPRYYHEWRTWSILLLVAAAAGIVQEAVEFAPFQNAAELAENMLAQPMVAMYSATFLIALRAAVARKDREKCADRPEIAALSLWRFCVVFFALLITLACAVPALAALSCSLWLTRWYDLPGL